MLDRLLGRSVLRHGKNVHRPVRDVAEDAARIALVGHVVIGHDRLAEEGTKHEIGHGGCPVGQESLELHQWGILLIGRLSIIKVYMRILAARRPRFRRKWRRASCRRPPKLPEKPALSCCRIWLLSAWKRGPRGIGMLSRRRTWRPKRSFGPASPRPFQATACWGRKGPMSLRAGSAAGASTHLTEP